MALFEKIENDTEANESIIAGFAGGIIITLLCTPAFFSIASKYLNATSSYERAPSVFLYPYLPEIILFVVLAFLSFLFYAKKKSWIAISLIGIAIARLYIVHGLNDKPYGVGLFISFLAILLLIEGTRGAKAINHLKKNNSGDIQISEDKSFDYDEWEASQKVRLGSYGGYIISTYLFFSIFMLIFSELRQQMVASYGIATYFVAIIFLTLFLMGFSYLSWRVARRKDTVSAVILLIAFALYVALTVFSQFIAVTFDPLAMTTYAIILALLVIGVIATIKYNKKYK